MRRHVLAAGVLALAASGGALAQTCPCVSSASRLNAVGIVSLLGNATVCAALGNDRWQEFHAGTRGGELSDWKGTSSAATREVVGTWVVEGAGANSAVRYTYSGGTSYAYAVCTEAAAVHFCGSALGGRNITNARIGSATTGCN